MKIGVVCEGPTDFIAISNFLASSLKSRGIEATFIDIQPQLDASSASRGGGWSNALIWLEENSLASRKIAYLGQGLFANNLSQKLCDYIVIQIDTDVLDDSGFINFVKAKKGIHAVSRCLPNERFDEIQNILLSFSELSDVDNAKKEFHIVAPAVENTETWCSAARLPDIPNIEALKKPDIAREFFSRLSDFIGENLTDRDLKNTGNRRTFCEAHADKFNRIEAHCTQYLRLVDDFI